MGLMQIRFEDAASAVTVYGLWDDDETPSLVTILASLPDAFRADNLHPQAKGYDIWGAAVKDKLAELMR